MLKKILGYIIFLPFFIPIQLILCLYALLMSILMFLPILGLALMEDNLGLVSYAYKDLWEEYCFGTLRKLRGE